MIGYFAADWHREQNAILMIDFAIAAGGTRQDSVRATRFSRPVCCASGPPDDDHGGDVRALARGFDQGTGSELRRRWASAIVVVLFHAPDCHALRDAGGFDL